ncbi:MAG: methylmalonyl-CoA mutase family protein, partial [Gemmatimonadales bacterium]
DYSRLAAEQKARLEAARSSRDSVACEAALARLHEAAAGGGQLIEPIMEAVRARATVGEISDVMRGLWGTFERGV